MATLTTLSSFAVVGVVVSLIIEYTKKYFAEADTTMRTIYGLIASIIGGVIVYGFPFIPQNIIADVIGVIAAVNTAYVFLVQYLPNSSVPPSASVLPQVPIPPSATP